MIVSDPGKPSLAAVLLAAGHSRRFGAANKLLAEVGGVPLVRRSATTLCSAPDIARVIVVTGHDEQAVREALAGLDVGFVHNPASERGLGSSVATGFAALGSEFDGAFAVPADLPFLTTGLLAALAAAFDHHGGSCAVYPADGSGTQRNPVLWPRRAFPALAALAGEAGGKLLLAEFGAVAVPVPDPLSLTDVDTAEDLASARAGPGRRA